MNFIFFFRSVSLNEWQEFSNEIIRNAEQEREMSVNLRSMIDGILQQIANDMKKQCTVVNFAFQQRIDETKDAKQKLEDNLNKVRQIHSGILRQTVIPDFWSYSFLSYHIVFTDQFFASLKCTSNTIWKKKRYFQCFDFLQVYTWRKSNHWKHFMIAIKTTKRIYEMK